METYKQREYIGIDSIQQLPHILKGFDAKKIFFATTRKVFEKCGAKEYIESILKDKDVEYFFDFESNPKVEHIEKGIARYHALNPDVVVALGGGSVIDIAKGISILAAQEGEPRDFVVGKKEIKPSSMPVIVIPTTAGTGSESTHFSVVYVDGIKYSLAHPSILPTVAIVDPKLTFSLSASAAATSGADALCQTIESYWSIYATDESKQYAKEAMPMLFCNLKTVVLNPTEEARIAMSVGAHLAGKAINISKTTASHAISYPITSRIGIPHGQAVSLTLPSLLLYNSKIQAENTMDPRGVVYVQRVVEEIVRMLGFNTAQEASNALHDLFASIGLSPTEEQKEKIRTSIELIITESSAERMGNNPRRLSEVDLRMLLETII